ncbi:protein mab-21-like 3 isoform X3 [Cetorhinus maximus]
MIEFTEEDLDFYLLNQVHLRDREVSKTEEEVYAIVQELTSAISTEDSRFQPISHSGINNENIKDQLAIVAKWSSILTGKRAQHSSIQVQSPTQFFIMVPVRGLAAYTERKARQWRYYTLTGSKLISPVQEPEKLHQWLEVDQFLKGTQEWHEPDVTIEGDIVPSKVVAIFKALLEKPLQASNFHGKINVLESVGPTIRLAVETTEQHVEVEIVPAIEIANHWPKKARWPRFLKRWPSKEKARTVKVSPPDSSAYVGGQTHRCRTCLKNCSMQKMGLTARTLLTLQISEEQKMLESDSNGILEQCPWHAGWILMDMVVPSS